MVRISLVSKSLSFFLAKKVLISLYLLEMMLSFESAKSWLKPLIKCMNLVTSSSPTAMFPDVS
ncbi:Uncharacterised protein [Segatella copri]|nr:Uncharacterised protein [Segatella copri]